MFKRLAYIDRFRGFRVTVPRPALLGGRGVRFGYNVRPEHFSPAFRRWWWKRHPIDTAVCHGFGTPFGGVTHYRGIATHFGVRVSPRVTLSLSLLGRWAPRWWSRYWHARWLARLEAERLAWLETLVVCDECGERTDPADPFCSCTLDDWDELGY